MSYNVAILKAMQAEGLDLDACIRVLEAGEKKADPTAAERKRRQRAKSRRDVTRDPPNDIDNLTPGVEANASPPKMGFVLPADIPAEPWGGFEEMRKRIRKPMTDKARSLAVSELRRLRDEEGWPPGTVLNHCTMNSYQGIYPPPKASKNGPSIGKSAAAYAMLNPGDEPM